MPFIGTLTGNFAVHRNPAFNLTPGLYLYTYSGYFNDDNTWFDSNTPLSSDTDTLLSIPNLNTTISIQYLGYFIPSTTESYTFYTTSDDASYMWVGQQALSGYTTSNAIVNNGSNHAEIERSGTIPLNAGQKYPVRIQSGNGGGPGSFSAAYSTATIFKNSNFTGLIFFNPITNGF